jgi:hypothetical protein
MANDHDLVDAWRAVSLGGVARSLQGIGHSLLELSVLGFGFGSWQTLAEL